MIEEKLADYTIFDTQIRESLCNELSKLVIVKGKEQIPINKFCHGDFDLFFLVSLDIIDF
jgi:hypothetical protein